MGLLINIQIFHLVICRHAYVLYAGHLYVICKLNFNFKNSYPHVLLYFQESKFAFKSFQYFFSLFFKLIQRFKDSCCFLQNTLA